MSDAKPCPDCGGTAMQARGIHAWRGRAVMHGYYWHCFNDGQPPPGIIDCERTGPECETAAEATSAWNALEPGAGGA